MKYLLLFLLVIPFNSNAQTVNTRITKFINSVYTQVIDSGQSQYVLFGTGNSPKEFNNEEIDFSFKNTIGIPKRPKNIPFIDLKEAIQKDTNSINWNNYALQNVRIVSRSQFGCRYFSVLNITANTPDSILKKPIQHCEVRVYIKPGSSKKEIDSLENKAMVDYNHQPGFVENCYFFSKPVFSKDGKYALMSVDTFYEGRVCVFKLTNNKWVKIFTFGFYNI